MKNKNKLNKSVNCKELLVLLGNKELFTRKTINSFMNIETGKIFNISINIKKLHNIEITNILKFKFKIFCIIFS